MAGELSASSCVPVEFLLHFIRWWAFFPFGVRLMNFLEIFMLKTIGAVRIGEVAAVVDCMSR